LSESAKQAGAVDDGPAFLFVLLLLPQYFTTAK
jgi:hypothetical protein